MEINGIVNAVTGNTQVAVLTELLKKSQDVVAQSASKLIESTARNSPSPQGVGQNIDLQA